MAVYSTTSERADLYEVTMPLLKAMHAEFKEISKKKPDAAVSKMKCSVVNRLLRSCRDVLAAEKSLEFLDLIDEDDVPQNSDLTLMLSQYVAAMQQYHGMHTDYKSDWILEGEDDEDDEDEDGEDEEG